jgi:hypothetical protein
MPVERWLLERIDAMRLRLGYTRSDYVKRALVEALLSDHRSFATTAETKTDQPAIEGAE